MKKIITIDQRSIMEYGLNMDIVDAALCSVIDEQLLPVPVKYVVDQLPIIGLKPDTIYRRLFALVEQGILEVSTEPTGNYYAVSKHYKNLF